LKNYTDVPDFEITNPIGYFSIMDNDGKFKFKPGDGFFYSSTNYLLLQYVLASLSGAKTWKEYDQMSIFPDKLRPKFNHTMFINHGKCSEYTK